ncbi:MAG: tetratricopeptide repeat protein [Nitrospiraceae bacterium]
MILVEEEGLLQDGTGTDQPSRSNRRRAARTNEEAFALLQNQKSAEEALGRLNRAIAYDPSFGDAYVLKSYVQLEILPNVEEALVAARAAVQYTPQNPDSHYTLGLVFEKQGQFKEANGPCSRRSSSTLPIRTCISPSAPSTLITSMNRG